MTKKDESERPAKPNLFETGSHSVDSKNERLMLASLLAEKRMQLLEIFDLTGEEVFKNYAKGIGAAIKLIRGRDEQLNQYKKYAETGCKCRTKECNGEC